MYSRVLLFLGLCFLSTALMGTDAPLHVDRASTTESSPSPAVAPLPADAPPTVVDKAPAARSARQVYVIPVRGEIGSAVLYVVRRGIKEAIEQKADAVVLDLKTPGGALGPTFEIMEAIGKFPGVTLTYVNSEAMSAGAFISATTNEIWFAPDGIIGAAAPVSAGGQDVDETMKLKIVSYLKARVRALSEGKAYRGEVISAMIDSQRELKIGDKVIKEKGELLSLTAAEAAQTYGEPPQPLLSSGTAKSLDDLIGQRFPDGRPNRTTLVMTWSESLAAWLNSISPILLGIGMLALFIEFKTPGFGVFGIVGIAALGIVFVSSYIAGLSGHEPVLVFSLGLVLLALELFVFPGIVLLGLSGVVLILGSLVWAMADLWPNEPLQLAWSGDAFTRPLTNLAFGLAISVAGALVLLRYLPRGWFIDRLIVQSAVDGAAQIAGGGVQTEGEARALVGRRGVAMTSLHPSGQVEIDGRRYEARVELGAIERGRPVVVRSASDFGLIVEEQS